jgi:hypothetical protein
MAIANGLLPRVHHHFFVGKSPQLPQATYNNTRSNTHAASIVTAAVPGIDIHLEIQDGERRILIFSYLFFVSSNGIK